MMDKATKKLLIGTGLIAAGIGGATALSYQLVKTMLDMAMDRQAPTMTMKNKERISGAKNVDKLLEQLADNEEKLKNCPCETVEITSHDGLKLVGHWYGCDNPKRVIVAMHGWRSSWTKDFGIISEFWHANDCCVLYAEQRGQGGSEGEYMTFGLLERYDCLDWIHWVNERIDGKLPIYLGGVSMGATTILMTAGFELPSNVRGIVADCGFTSPYAIWKHVMSRNLHLPYEGVGALFVDRMSKQKVNLSPKDYSTLEAMAKCTVPVLFVHGTDDSFVPIEMTYENYKACAAPKRLLIVPGAQHGMSYVVDRELYETAVRQLWQDYDALPEETEKTV